MSFFKFSQFFIFSIFVIFVFGKDVEVNRPRGVSLAENVLYDISKDFTCFDGSRTIPFRQVNDDFCDCTDGSDEPGTSACPNGIFHCINSGYRSKNIPSSRVNDGLCDCCDGSDEWKNQSLCSNTCAALFEIAKEEFQKKMAEANEGFIKRQEFSQTGKAKKEERQKVLADLENQLNQLKETEKLLEEEKNEIEAKETQAKEERRKIMEEEIARKAEEENLARGARSFEEMDTDKDASLTLTEFLVHSELDPDPSDGEFKEDEGITFLIQPSVDLNQFMETVWPIINTTFQTTLLPPVEFQEEPIEAEDRARQEEEDAFRAEQTEKQIAEQEESDDEYLDEEYEEEDDFDNEEDEQEENDDEDDENSDEIRNTPAPTGEELYYDDATRELIQLATEARDKYQKNQDEKKNMESEIGQVRKALELDFGPDEAFQALQFQCYEFDTLEYTYKLCPFQKSSQKPKNGGSETSLGRWGSWNGPDNFKYSSMKYDGGQSCWNGPSRSTEVHVVN